MKTGSYSLATARSIFAVAAPRLAAAVAEGPAAPVPGLAILEYLRVAAGRARASSSTVALAVAMRDLWTGHSGDGPSRSAFADIEALELLTLVVATAGSGSSIQDGKLNPDARPRLRRVNAHHALPYWRF